MFPINEPKYLRKLLSSQLKATNLKYTFTPEQRSETGAVVFKILMQSLELDPKKAPMLKQEMTLDLSTNKRKGVVKVSKDMIRYMTGRATEQKNNIMSFYLERRLPMICKPARWTDWESGGYLQQDVPIMRMQGSKLQRSALERADIKEICEVLNLMGDTPWRINKRVLEILEQSTRRAAESRKSQ